MMAEASLLRYRGIAALFSCFVSFLAVFRELDTGWTLERILHHSIFVFQLAHFPIVITINLTKAQA